MQPFERVQNSVLWYLDLERCRIEDLSYGEAERGQERQDLLMELQNITHYIIVLGWIECETPSEPLDFKSRSVEALPFQQPHEPKQRQNFDHGPKGDCLFLLTVIDRRK